MYIVRIEPGRERYFLFVPQLFMYLSFWIATVGVTYIVFLRLLL
jgi:hypothetical protein